MARKKKDSLKELLAEVDSVEEKIKEAISDEDTVDQSSPKVEEVSPVKVEEDNITYNVEESDGFFLGYCVQTGKKLYRKRK
jgi:hypothetical protein